MFLKTHYSYAQTLSLKENLSIVLSHRRISKKNKAKQRENILD